MGDKVRVLKTGFTGRIVGKKEFLNKIIYLVEQDNGHDIEVEGNGLRKAR